MINKKTHFLLLSLMLAACNPAEEATTPAIAGAAVASRAALVRAALKNMNTEIALFPSGSARVQKITTAEVESPDGPVLIATKFMCGFENFSMKDYKLMRL